jgi:hypothetical protein
LVVEIQKGILLYSCHIVRKFLNIDTEHNKTTKSKCGGETPVIMLISTALLLDSNIRNSVCTIGRHKNLGQTSQLYKVKNQKYTLGKFGFLQTRL